MLAAGEKGLCAYLHKEALRFQQATVTRVLLWAANAAVAHEAAKTHQRVWQTLEEDRAAKTLQIDAVERDLAGLLACTPYVLLLSHPGINLVSAAELAGEMGPITNYASLNPLKVMLAEHDEVLGVVRFGHADNSRSQDTGLRRAEGTTV